MEEHDPYAFEEPFGEQMSKLDAEDASLAATEEALQAEREKLDEALSEYHGANLADPHADEREELHGNSLLWWRDTSLLNAHVAMGDLFDEALVDFDRAKMLLGEGVNPNTMHVELPLNFVTGPLVLCGLQLLGLHVPEFRDEIAALIKAFPFPVATEEETAEVEAAITRLEEKARARADAIRQEIIQRMQAEQDANLGDSELGLGLN